MNPIQRALAQADAIIAPDVVAYPSMTEQWWLIADGGDQRQGDETFPSAEAAWEFIDAKCAAGEPYQYSRVAPAYEFGL